MKIGVITNDEAQVFQKQVILGIRSFFEARNYEIVVANTGSVNAPLDKVNFDIAQLDGVLVIANALSDAAALKLHSEGTPLALVSHQVPYSAIPSVIPDNVGGIRQLVNYLVTWRGRRRIAFIQGDLAQNDGVERNEAFLQSLMRHHIAVDKNLLLQGDFIRSHAAHSTEALLESGVKFDAIAAADYLMAIDAMQTLKAHHVNVPQEVCVVGFGDGPEAAEVGLTTVGVDVERIGWHAARQVLGLLQGLEIRGVTLLATSIVERASC